MRYEFVNKALMIEYENRRIIVIADLHIGYEEMLNEQGVLIPRRMFQDIIKDLNNVFDNISRGNKGVRENDRKKVEEIVILGDLKHEFGIVNKQEWKETSDILEMLKKRCEKIVIVKGNHDKIIEPIARKNGVDVRDFYVDGEIAFLHGDKMNIEIIDKRIKTIVMGHMHPAVTLKDKYGKSERYKCFLKGIWKGKQIFILPSFFPLVEGTDVFVADNKMGFDFDLSKFDVYAVGEDRVYEFGKREEIEGRD